MSDASPMSSAAPPGTGWKRYPFLIPGADERHFTFPAAEGDQGLATNRYFVEARLRGIRSGRELAFLTIFSTTRAPAGPLTLRDDLYVLSLFDLGSGRYGTATEHDLPRAGRMRRQYRLSVARGLLDVSFAGREGRARLACRRDASGAPVPFSYSLDLCGRDQNGLEMRVELDLEVRKPPAPVGGDELRGVMTSSAQPGTFSYFQTGIELRGRVRWGELEDQVAGDVGWIDRQFARQPLGTFTDRRNSRHRHEWRVLHLDNGWDLSAWQQFDSERGDRLVPFSGVTAQGPEGEVRTTTDFKVERLSFARDPGGFAPPRPLATGTRYLTDRFHLSVREWDLYVTAEPLVAAPAHRTSVEYWNGPVRLIGQMAGRAVSGFGFHERTKLWYRPFDLVFVLRETLRHQPASGHAGVSPRALANQVWECEVLLARDDRRGVLELLTTQVEPALERLAPPGREAARDACRALIESLAD
jgi:hypothetical protein